MGRAKVEERPVESPAAELPQWLALLPGEWVDPRFGELWLAEQAARGRRNVVGARAAELGARVTAVISDPAADPLLAVPIEQELAATLSVLDRMPPIPVVPTEMHQAIASQLGQSFSDLSPGSAPAGANEQVHWRQYHLKRNEPMPPRLTDQDHDVIQAFELVAAQASGWFVRTRELGEPLGRGESVAGRVHAWSALLTSAEWTQFARDRDELRRLVAIDRRQRVEQGKAHRCQLQNGMPVGPQRRIPVSDTPWTLRGQLAEPSFGWVNSSDPSTWPE